MSTAQPLYGTERWRRRAKAQLRAEPLCAMCLGEGITTAATVADHVVPHRGDVDAFWSNALSSLCAHHHSQSKQREEARGFTDRLDGDGWPADARHPANAHSAAPVGRHGPSSRSTDTPGGIEISRAFSVPTGGGLPHAAPQNFSRGSKC